MRYARTRGDGNAERGRAAGGRAAPARRPAGPGARAPPRRQPPSSRAASTSPTRWSRRLPGWRPWRSRASPTWAATSPRRWRACASASASATSAATSVKADVQGHQVAISVTIMVEFGHVVLEVARQVQANVALQTQCARMLLTVVEVNVTVDDVRTPKPPRREQQEEAAAAESQLDATPEPVDGVVAGPPQVLHRGARHGRQRSACFTSAAGVAAGPRPAPPAARRGRWERRRRGRPGSAWR